MDGFFRRGDVWWARLAVPARLRQAAGRREFVQSCRTTDKHAGRVVAAALLAQWRRKLFELGGGRVDIEKLVGGGPALVAGGHLSLQRAVELLGFDLGDLLRAASAGRIGLHCRIPPGAANGFVVPSQSLESVDAELGQAGGVVIPSPNGAPNDSIRAQMVGQVLPLVDSAIVAGQVLAGELGAVELVCMEAPGRPGWLYVPDVAPVVSVGSLEVLAVELEALRAAAVAVIPAERMMAKTVTAPEPPTQPRGGKWAGKRFSEALEAYCASPDGLPKTLASEVEQRQRKAGMMLFPEFMGDLPLGAIDGDVLRQYRDGPLKTFPGNANHLPKEVKRPTMKATIEALRAARPDWPLMSPTMQRERMQWLRRFFAWLVARGYMDADPSSGLAGETGVSKADAKAARRDAAAARKEAGEEDGRGPFSGDELTAIFSQPLFVRGHGRHVVGAERCGPHEFWLPLLGLFGGLRLKEASQLRLTDVRQVDGVWGLDLNEDTPDKSLKNEQSARLVPLHPALVAAGFLDYCDRLRREGFRRVFPELSCVASDARYSKDSGRRMSMMLEKLGMPRDGGRVFHSFRHNMNNALARVPAEVLGFADATLARVARYAIMGHDLPPGERDVNTASYLRGRTSEMAALVAAVQYEGLPTVARFDAGWGVEAIRDALGRKHGDRKGKEDMGEVLHLR
ncbi:hypothetical protein C8C99_4042 [Acidovorax sp. 107]|uniref:DUF6538 domain-containing protein n=1 Tax=Acidovorax sp. 107 TaxID=2135638 RepID=UPI000D3F0319|nr:DUF6538 domain-containing protein [Acidovorax sp. 107]PUA99159.1 hypothetical protein C8C99_4042 [Acidovorax sp. 107]